MSFTYKLLVTTVLHNAFSNEPISVNSVVTEFGTHNEREEACRAIMENYPTRVSTASHSESWERGEIKYIVIRL